MIIQIKVPSPGESINEVEITSWLVSDGDFVEKDQEIAEIESEKATLPLIASESGRISIIGTTGKPIPVGEVVCTIDTSKKGAGKKSPTKKEPLSTSVPDPIPVKITDIPRKEDLQMPVSDDKIRITPLAKQMMQDHQLSADDVIPNLRRITRKEVSAALSSSFIPGYSTPKNKESTRNEERVRMSVLRRKISERLVSVKNETAMLTTFNEVDMSAIIGIRKKYQEEFMKAHGIKLGFMSFFTKAVSLALQVFPVVNSRIVGEDMVIPAYTDIGIAVQTDKGLMVPVIRNVEDLTLAEIERAIAELAGKARNNKISIEEMKGGTFTITNGGIYGSMLSTPILNPPQSAILGMHTIIDRPVALHGQVVIRPMMYIALSYDHRIIDGRDSVSFLVKIKEMIEDPGKMLFSGADHEKLLLNL